MAKLKFQSVFSKGFEPWRLKLYPSCFNILHNMLLQINWFPIGHNTVILSHYVPNVLQVSGFKYIEVPLHISIYAYSVDYEAS